MFGMMGFLENYAKKPTVSNFMFMKIDLKQYIIDILIAVLMKKTT